jgi:F-type H+-transporting ATPase subunit epsilon
MMTLMIISPKGVICKETVSKVSLPGTLGPFTVLTNHAPIIATLQKGIIRYETDGKLKETPVEKGIVEVNKNTVNVLVET